jgi:hypothetical protein
MKLRLLVKALHVASDKPSVVVVQLASFCDCSTVITAIEEAHRSTS